MALLLRPRPGDCSRSTGDWWFRLLVLRYAKLRRWHTGIEPWAFYAPRIGPSPWGKRLLGSEPARGVPGIDGGIYFATFWHLNAP